MAERPRTGPRTQLRCAIYTRKSTEEGLEQDFNSLDAQREACAAYILSQRHEGWTPVASSYDDGGYSGGSMERPGLKMLLADIAAGKIDVVVVYKVDRLTRTRPPPPAPAQDSLSKLWVAVRAGGSVLARRVVGIAALFQASCAGPATLCNESNEEIDPTDPESVEGRTEEEVAEAAKRKGWKEEPARTGTEKGRRFSDVSGNNGIRIMRGGDNRTDTDSDVKSGGPYAKIVGGRYAGAVVPLAGNKSQK